MLFDYRIPLLKRDLYFLRHRLGLSRADFKWYFSLPLQDNPADLEARELIPDASDRILALLLSEYPELCSLYKKPFDDLEFVLDLAEELDTDLGIDHRVFGMVIGRGTYYTGVIRMNLGAPSPEDDSINVLGAIYEGEG